MADFGRLRYNNWITGPLNRRVKKDLDTGTDILCIYDGWQCIEERNAASPSTVLRQYVYGSQYIDEVVCKIEDPGGTPSKLFYLHDCNYNVVALTNTSGAVQERYNYEPYGGLTIAEADYDVISATTQNNSLTFQGQRYDAESGLYYFRNRYLSPVLGRFLQRDPLYVTTATNGGSASMISILHPSPAQQDGDSLYEFVGGNPATQRDPHGLWSCCLEWTPLWAIGGYSDPICCAENIIGKTWWGPVYRGLELALGGAAAGAATAHAATYSGALSVGSSGGVLAFNLAIAPVAGGVIGWRIALDTCMKYVCSEAQGAQRTVLKSGWFFDTVRYSCKRGTIFKYGEEFDIPPNRFTGRTFVDVWE